MKYFFLKYLFNRIKREIIYVSVICKLLDFKMIIYEFSVIIVLSRSLEVLKKIESCKFCI